MTFPHAIITSLVLAACHHAFSEPFAANQRIGFVGDSLTRQGGYHTQIFLFYATRFPNAKLTVKNFGIAGDTAAGCEKRYEWDIKPFKAGVFTLTTGVNDVSRGLYMKSSEGLPDLQKRKQEAIDRHIKGTETFIRKAQADGAKVIVMSPSLFDQTAEIKEEKQTGINDALRIMSEADQKTAQKYGCLFIDFNTPLLEINRQEQAADPTFTIVGPDRIHPQAPGHFIMAYLFLKAQGLSPVVAEVIVDASNTQKTSGTNCSVTHVTTSENGISYDYLAKALPFPIGRDSAPALKYCNFHDELNREMLTVKNLPKGKYEILFDGVAVQTVTDEQLSRGVNLAKNNRTPQHKQAMAVRDIIQKRKALESQMSFYPILHQQFLTDKGQLTPDQEIEILKDTLAKLGKANLWNRYRSGCIESYLKVYPKLPQIRAEFDKLSEQIYVANQPQSHHVEIRKK